MRLSLSALPGLLRPPALAAMFGFTTALAAGCATTGDAAVPLVRAHATYDLDCAGSDIRIEEEIGGRYKAVGCGRKAVYRTACDGLSCVVNSESGPAIPWRDRPPPDDIRGR